MQLKISQTKRLIIIGLLGAISFLLMYLQINIPGFPTFLKIDISDLPGIIGVIFFGYGTGIEISLLKNILHLVVSQSMGIGELVNFLISCSYFGIFYIINIRCKKLFMPFIIAVIFTSIISIPLNYYIMFPCYKYILGINPEQIVGVAKSINPMVSNLKMYLLFVIVPFNFIKFTITSIVSYNISFLLNSKKVFCNL